MRICVTGGSGFIGVHFCRVLHAAGHEAVVLDLVDPPADMPFQRFVRGDIRDPEAAHDAMTGCDAVLHLAAAHHDFGIEEATFVDVNERGTQVLCDAMDAAGIRPITFYSTVAVYGTAAPPLAETTEPEPFSPYGRSKLAAECLLAHWAGRGEGRRCLVIRPTVTYGRENFANMYSLIRQVDRRRFLMVGAGDNIKSLSYIENIIAATMYLWDHPGPEAFAVYNYIDTPDLTSRRIAEIVYEALGRTPPRWSVPMWVALLLALPFDLLIALTGRNIPVSSARVRKLFADQTKFEAHKVLKTGFQPAVSVEEGIRRMTAWYDERGRHESADWHLPPDEPVMRNDASS